MTYYNKLIFLALLLPVYHLMGQIELTDGYGANDGGLGGDSVLVTSASEIRQYAESETPYIIGITGDIDLGGDVRVKSDKTIYGTDEQTTLHGQLSISDAQNIIIKNLSITNLSENGDGIALRNSTNVFISHCTVFDCTDGLIDITRASDFVTVSYCKFYYAVVENHKFPNLIGASDNDLDDRGKLHVTFHHNWWAEGCVSRMPNIRFGSVHMYNNYFSCTGNNYCSRARIEAQILSEYNYYDQVRDPLIVEEGGIAKSVGNVYFECTNNIYEAKDIVFSPDYSYSFTKANCAKREAMYMAGNIPPDQQFVASVQKTSTDEDTLLIDEPMEPKQYTWTVSDSIIFEGLPSWAEVVFDSTSNLAIVSGTPVDKGDFIFTISTNDPCAENTVLQDTISVLHPDDLLSISENKIHQVLVYPNPSRGYFDISSEISWSKISSISIYDLSGSVVFHQPVNSNRRIHHHLKKGTYLVRFEGLKNFGNMKLRVE